MKKIILLFGAVSSAMVILTSCGGASDNKEVKEADASSIALDPNKTISDNVAAKPTATSAGIADLLQGKWQHIEDKSNYLIFEGNHRRETAAGGAWDDETFVLSDQCANPSNKDNGIEREKDRYISCVASDLCWYVIEVDQEKLSLSYMGRGNTLSYTRVK